MARRMFASFGRFLKAAHPWQMCRDVFIVFMLMLLTGCSMIDDDLSDCGANVRLDYDLHLVTNLTIELQAELDKRNDAALIKALRDYLSPIFTDYARDIDLSFYDIQGDSARLHHEQHQMDANEMSYTLYLPRRHYMHTAVANVSGNRESELIGDNHCHAASLSQSKGDSVGTHRTGLFTARQMMRISETGDQSFFVHLYMANCAAALVLDVSEADLSDVKVVATGFASHFRVADSTYVFDQTPQIVKADKVATGNSRQLCFCTVNFPSRELGTRAVAPSNSMSTRSIIETEEPFVSESAEEGIWELRVYTTLTDGKVTENRLWVKKPLFAGQFKIFHARVYKNGALEPDEPEVGVSVTLDWKPGNTYEPVI